MAKQARALQTRRSIVEAAASVFAEYGYERAATSEILRRANVTKGAMYFHFPSKESLAQAIMDEQTGLVTVEPRLSPCSRSSTSRTSSPTGCATTPSRERGHDCP